MSSLIMNTCIYVNSVGYHVVVVTGLIGVHGVHPCYNYFVLCCRPSPLAYPTYTTTLLMTSYLPIKTLVAR